MVLHRIEQKGYVSLPFRTGAWHIGHSVVAWFCSSNLSSATMVWRRDGSAVMVSCRVVSPVCSISMVMRLIGEL